MLQPGLGAGSSDQCDLQLIPTVKGKDGKRRQRSHIGKQARNRGANLISEADERRMDCRRTTKPGWTARKRLHETPPRHGNVVLTGFLA
jgi:hypothetical protein